MGVASAVGASPAGDVATAAASLRAVLDSLGGTTGGRGFRGNGGATPPPNFVNVGNALVSQLEAQDNGDMAPTPAALRAFATTCGDLRTVVANWSRVVSTSLPALNAALTKSGGPAVSAPSGALAAPACGPTAGISAAAR
jgi:hypothetical protein